MTTPTSQQNELQQLCQRYRALLLSIDEQTVSIAISGKVSSELLSALKFASNRRILVEEWTHAQLEQAMHADKRAEEPRAPFITSPALEQNEEMGPLFSLSIKR